MPLFPGKLFTQSPNTPLAAAPVAESPTGVNVKVLLAPERLALARTTMDGCKVVSLRIVLTPFFVIRAIQRLPNTAAQFAPSALGQTELLARLLMAAVRALCSSATISLADEVSRLLRTRLVKLGRAIAVMIARSATVTISSTRVNPGVAEGPAPVGPRCSMTSPKSLAMNLNGRPR
ncbi:hypothetical protein DSC_12305 [Pseudoxanthomonas spadix BD-a59]|uniref:Uncharacterized protein n=1 Tax=Pseudoxanthomonas spadix (strain BD-a59) TaxID=1045855 RepID=G7URB3_PSEUP|nr:hypothetical protein DSC_12305 [Pseudoxanthomonas spadix BD-a59]